MSSLRHKDKLLLERYRDGECGFFRRYAAERLLERSEEAVDFFGSLESLGAELTRLWPKTEMDFWNKVEKRITELQLEHEKSEQYSKSKATILEVFSDRLSAIVSSFSSLVSPIFASPIAIKPAASVGFSMAALAIVLPGVFMLSGISLQTTVDADRESGASGIKPRRVSLPSSFFADEMRAYNARDLLSGAVTHNSPVKIDWVRSVGETQVLHGSDGSGAPAFWVSNNSRLSSATSDPVLEATSKKTLFLSPRSAMRPAERVGAEGGKVDTSEPDIGLAYLRSKSVDLRGDSSDYLSGCSDIQSLPGCQNSSNR